MATKSDSPTFPTPERKELFTYGFPNLKWLKEILFQDEHFDYILSRYCIFFLIIFFSIQNFISKHFDKIISSLFSRLFQYFRQEMLKWEPNSPPVSSFPNLILERGVIFQKNDPDKILNSMKFWGNLSGPVYIEEWFM